MYDRDMPKLSLIRIYHIFILAFLGAGCTPPITPIASPAATQFGEPASTATPVESLVDQQPFTPPTAQPTVDSGFTFAGTIPAPDFPAGLEWLNVPRPLSLAQDLRGKIVILDFWTLGCINCIHIIPDLKRLEEDFPESLVVIGVHSAKFTTEGQLESIRQAVLRYGIDHPVVNDVGLPLWNTYGARAWPTLFLIDPLGNIVGYHAGEGVYDILRPAVVTMEYEFREAGLLDETPLDLLLERRALVPSILSFPGKVLADEAGDRLFIADSNHNRIVVTTLAGEIRFAIGSGAAGIADGPFETASFYRPQGMALSEDGRTLYIADLENHAIRSADLEAGTVSTIAGTGSQGMAYPTGSPGLETALNSPWDLLLHEGNLFIATAGLHQIWVYDIANDRVDVFAGSGLEGIDDGLPLEASLAQPSGFATDGDLLYFTDPESSAVRQVGFDPDAGLSTIIGTGLFDWGDVDGAYPKALLQHPLGIAFHNGLLYIADTYNQKLKVIDPVNKLVATWAGDGRLGWADGTGAEVRFAEPSGLSIANGRLYIADTNNHLIRVGDLVTGEVTTLVMTNLTAALPPASSAGVPLSESFGVQTVGPGSGTLEIVFVTPEGYKFNDLGPFTLTWTAGDGSVISALETSYGRTGPEFPITFPVDLSAGETTIEITATAFYCEVVDNSLCLVQEVTLTVPIVVSAGSVGSDLFVSYELPSP